MNNGLTLKEASPHYGAALLLKGLIGQFYGAVAGPDDVNATFRQRDFRLYAIGYTGAYQLSVQVVDMPRFAERQSRYMQYAVLRPRL